MIAFWATILDAMSRLIVQGQGRGCSVTKRELRAQCLRASGDPQRAVFGVSERYSEPTLLLERWKS